MDAGERVPTPQWKVRYGLMLGLERVLSDKPPRLASGTELRRHQIDALAGMLTELIAANQQPAEAERQRQRRPSSRWRRKRTRSSSSRGLEDEDAGDAELTPEEDPGAKRRYRFRHPTASGKTIAAAGFVEAARTPRRPDPHASPPARHAVRPRAQGGGLRRPHHARDRPKGRSRCAATRSRSRRTRGSRGTSARSRATRTSS